MEFIGDNLKKYKTMTKNEYESTSGRTVTDEEWGKIEEVYYESLMPDDEFVREYEEFKDRKLMGRLIDDVLGKNAYVQDLRGKIEGLCSMLLVKALEYKDESMEYIAKNALDKKSLIKVKIESDIALDDEEKEYLINML